MSRLLPSQRKGPPVPETGLSSLSLRNNACLAPPCRCASLSHPYAVATRPAPQQTPYLKWLPADVRKIIEDKGITAALQFEVDMTREFIADTYFEEVRCSRPAGGRAGKGAHGRQRRLPHVYPPLPPRPPPPPRFTAWPTPPALTLTTSSASTSSRSSSRPRAPSWAPLAPPSATPLVRHGRGQLLLKDGRPRRGRRRCALFLKPHFFPASAPPLQSTLCSCARSTGASVRMARHALLQRQCFPRWCSCVSAPAPLPPSQTTRC